MVYRNYFHLIFKNGSNSGINICRCTVQPRASRFRIIMNLFPSISGYLKEDANGREIRYKKGFTINHLRRLSTSSRKTLSVTYDFKKLNKVVPIFIVKFLAIGFLFVQCSPEKTIWTESPEKTEQLTTTPNFLDPEQPTQETNPVVGYAVTATVTAITILGIVACTVIVYYRKEKKKKGTTPNKKGNVSASSKRLPGNSQASVSFDVADSLSHSYAEVGSISDYRHYVMPDDTSMQSFRTKNFLEELEEKTSPYGSSANPNSKPPDDTATRRKEQALQDMDNADKTDTENSATGKEVACFSKSKMPENIERVHLQNEKAKNQLCLVLAETTDKAKPDENTDLPKKSGEEHKFDRENKTISREHYDTSGYLDLNITEKTSHQYLQKWIKEIHSVEENVRKESENEGIQHLGQRRVLIAENDLAARQPDTFYSCADIHTIEFSDEETPFH